MICEICGFRSWSSSGANCLVGSITPSPEEQARYLRRQAQLLDEAQSLFVFQLTFTDLDLASFPPQPPGSILPLFANLGLVTADLVPKPALAVWDSVFALKQALAFSRLR